MSPDEQLDDTPEATEDNAPAPTVDQPISNQDTSPEPPNEAEDLAVEEEAPAPSTLHPSAAAGTTPEDDDVVKGREEYGEYFIGMWGNLPNFGCPYCFFSTVENGGNGLTELHVLAMIDTGDLNHMAALNLKGE